MHNPAVFLLRKGFTSPVLTFFRKLLWLWNIAATKVTKQRKRSQTTLKKQSETVITSTTYRAKDGATEGQATTLTGSFYFYIFFFATNRFWEKRKMWKWQTERESLVWNRAAILLFFFFGKFSLHGGAHKQHSTVTTHSRWKTHFRQLTSCLSAQAIWSKSSWCTKESKMVYFNMRNNHSKEQPNVTQESELQLSESKGSANETNKH